MSKKQFQQRITLMYVIVFMPALLVACVAASSGKEANGGGFFALITSPGFATLMGGIITGIGATLPLIQLWLKRMPTSESVKLTGPLGFILDVLTWYQKDILKVAKPVDLTLQTGTETVTAKVVPQTETVQGAAIGASPAPAAPGTTEVTVKQTDQGAG